MDDLQFLEAMFSKCQEIKPKLHHTDFDRLLRLAGATPTDIISETQWWTLSSEIIGPLARRASIAFDNSKVLK